MRKIIEIENGIHPGGFMATVEDEDTRYQYFRESVDDDDISRRSIPLELLDSDEYQEWDFSLSNDDIENLRAIGWVE